jgi:hypothetical protein
MRERSLAQMARSAVPAANAVPFRTEAARIDCGPLPVFNDRTARHRAVSDARRATTLQYDRAGRLMTGSNRL